MQNIFSGLGIALSAFAIPGLSAATVYTYNFTLNPSTFTYVTAGDLRYYVQTESIIPATDNPGDIYNFNIAFTKPFSVGPSKTLSEISVGFYDARLVPGGQNHHDAAENFSTSFTDYVGPPGLIESGSDILLDGYFGLGAFLSPNPGFSVTGISTSVKVVTTDPYPLVQLIVGSTFDVPEPGVWTMLLVGSASIGVAMRSRRMRLA